MKLFFVHNEGVAFNEIAFNEILFPLSVDAWPSIFLSVFRSAGRFYNNAWDVG